MFSEDEKIKFAKVFEEVMQHNEKNMRTRYTEITDTFNLNVLIKFGYVEKYKEENKTYVRVTEYGLDRHLKLKLRKKECSYCKQLKEISELKQSDGELVCRDRITCQQTHQEILDTV